jgi:hypothetical protein
MNISLDHVESASVAARARALRGRARIAIGDATFEGRAERVAAHGLSLLVDRVARERTQCAVCISVFRNGRLFCVRARGEVASCSCAGMQGFRVAVRFTEMGDADAEAVRQLLA